MEKVILPKEVGESIKFMRKKWADKAILQFENYSKSNINSYPQLKVIQDYFGFPKMEDTFDTLLQALVIGYEVEQTPEEKVKAYYDDLFPCSDGSWNHAKAEGVRATLNLLDITIKGVTN